MGDTTVFIQILRGHSQQARALTVSSNEREFTAGRGSSAESQEALAQEGREAGRPGDLASRRWWPSPELALTGLTTVPPPHVFAQSWLSFQILGRRLWPSRLGVDTRDVATRG